MEQENNYHGAAPQTKELRDSCIPGDGWVIQRRFLTEHVWLLLLDQESYQQLDNDQKAPNG